MFAFAHYKHAVTIALMASIWLAAGTPGAAEQAKPSPPPPRTPRIGFQGFGLLGVNVPVAKESFEAAGLDTSALELGGGAQVTDLWRNLFVEVSVSRWSGTGERVFLDDTGNRFPLGIPLEVETTHIDASVGWRVRGNGVATYFGGGAGAALYTEQSPFTQPGDDLDTRATSYHLLGGVEFPLRRWLALSGELRYRFVPGLLGDDGVSEALDEDRFGGLQAGLALRVGFGGWTAPEPRRPAPPSKPVGPAKEILKPQPRLNAGTITERAPVFLLPDATRKPLRMLEPGTSLRVLQETGDWVRVEFQDPQFGPRQGYVMRKFVRLTKQ